MNSLKLKGKPAIIINSLVVIVIMIMVFLGLKPPSIAMNDNGLDIGGLYGKLYEWDLIESVEVLTEMPKIGMRTNGMDLGSVQRGHYKVDGFGSATLYINKGHEAFITFKYEGRQIFISFAEKIKADEIYIAIMNQIK